VSVGRKNERAFEAFVEFGCIIAMICELSTWTVVNIRLELIVFEMNLEIE
jgi:hypothetical protein